MAGRRLDNVWVHFKKIPANLLVDPPTTAKARCKLCRVTISPLVARMKKHLEKCSQNQIGLEDSANEAEGSNINHIDSSSDSSLEVIAPARKIKKINEPSVMKHVVTTNKQQKSDLDEKCARMIFATNLPFRVVEHLEFKSFCESLRPGYKLPDRKVVGGELLDKVYKKVQEDSLELLRNEPVCMAIDGWSNIVRDPIICATVTKDDGRVFLVDTINTDGISHTSSNLLGIAKDSKKKAETIFKCKVRSFVTDNAANMKKMREDLQHEFDDSSFELISYGCSAHALNLLAHDFLDSDKNKARMISDIVAIIKYFRNHNLPNYWFKQAGGSEMKIPIDVRWNSHCDALQSYIDNWSSLAEVSEKYRLHDKFDANIGMCIQLLLKLKENRFTQ